MDQSEAEFLAKREKVQASKTEGIELNTNKEPNKVVHTEGKTSGSNTGMKINFAKLMKMSQQKKDKKSNNFKEAKNANIRRNDKQQRTVQKAYDNAVQE